MDRWTLQDSPGMLPALPGYNPVLDLDYLPEGWHAEYYGDDVLYVGFEGEMAFQIQKVFEEDEEFSVTRIEKYDKEVVDLLIERIKAIDAESYPIETYASKHMQGKAVSDG